MAAMLMNAAAMPKACAPTKQTLSARPAAAARALPRVSNGCRVRQMMVWTPVKNKFFETFSYLPPLKDDEIARQIDYIVNNGFVPTLEFAEAEQAYAQHTYTASLGGGQPGYYDNRYWTMWKLPMFGCSDPSQVLSEIRNCEKTFPEAYIRVVAFDSTRQVQCAGFLVHRPKGADEFRAPNERSVAEGSSSGSAF